VSSAVRLLLALALAASTAGWSARDAASGHAASGYAVAAADTSRAFGAAADPAGEGRVGSLPVGEEIGGFLSARGLPPRPGRFIVTDTGLVFHSADGHVAQTYPLVGPVRVRDGRRWRAPTVALAYTDSAAGRPVYVFRVDGGVFGTETPGPLMDVAAGPRWLDSIVSREWRSDRTLVSARDTAAMWLLTRSMQRSAFADTLHALFGRPVRPAGLIGATGRKAGRLGEYIASRDSLAIDPARMTSEEQLRHTVTHEMAHRWQARAPGQLRTLWQGVPPIRDSRRYGHRKVSEHQAEAISFAVHFLQATAAGSDPAAPSLLVQYDLLVPGTAVMARYLALQPIYAAHPLRRMLTTGVPE
jgi:hypothetical protein